MTFKDGAMTTKHSHFDRKIGVVSLGCAKTLVNTEQMMNLLRGAGYQISDETDGADAVLVNTCAFIESAKMEAIGTILDLGRMKKEGRVKKIIVTGCLPQLYKNEILAELPEVDAVAGVGSFDDIVAVADAALAGGTKIEVYGDINAPVSEAGRIITSSDVWTYLKIAEGCDNRCAFCVIPDIRGRFRSRSMEAILGEARWLAERGIKEIIIVAQDVTRYGLDIYGKRALSVLLNALCEIESIKWVRLHYLYPDEIDDELIDVIAKSDKILKYLDIPIQHINNGILKAMRRRGTGEDIKALLKKLRERVPGVVLRTSIIAGLPGEGETEFEELCEFLREYRIERAGIFAYSPEEGTDAALLKRPDLETAEERAALLTEIQYRVMDRYNESRVGAMATTLIEGCEDGVYFGRSYAESPEVDGYIRITGGKPEIGGFAEVRITGVEDGELAGVTV